MGWGTVGFSEGERGRWKSPPFVMFAAMNNKITIKLDQLDRIYKSALYELAQCEMPGTLANRVRMNMVFVDNAMISFQEQLRAKMVECAEPDENSATGFKTESVGNSIVPVFKSEEMKAEYDGFVMRLLEEKVEVEFTPLSNELIEGIASVKPATLRALHAIIQ